MASDAGSAVGIRRLEVRRHAPGGEQTIADCIAVEEPLEIRLAAAGDKEARSLAITMRTPGNDLELAAGFLYSEGLLRNVRDIAQLRHCDTAGNVVRVDSIVGAPTPAMRHARQFNAHSSCGVCGKESIEAVTTLLPVTRVGALTSVTASVLVQLPARLRAAQRLFEASGGLHAVGLFDSAGALTLLREDVGRHNAMDKLVGERLLSDRLPLSDGVLLLSGRASFELLQKAMAAGVPIVAAIGAPSSLAVDLAQRAGITLVGFLRENAFNIYTGGERIA